MSKKPLFCLISVFMIFTFINISYADVKLGNWVSVTGTAVLQEDIEDSLSNAKQAALDDAFRKAVIKVIGTKVSAVSLTENFVLVKKRILTRTKGYINDYKITSENTENGIYTVEVDVKVSAGNLKNEIKNINDIIEERSNPLICVYFNDESGRSSILEKDFLKKLRDKGFNIITGSSRSTDPGVLRKESLERDAQITMFVSYDVTSMGKDPVAGIALIYSTDIYIKCRVTDSGEVIYSDKVSEITGTGYTEKEAVKLSTCSAVDEIIDNIESAVIKRWKRELKQGFVVELVFNDLKNYEERSVEIKEALELIEGIEYIEEKEFSSEKKSLTIKVRFKGFSGRLKDELTGFPFNAYSLVVDSFKYGKISFTVKEK